LKEAMPHKLDEEARGLMRKIVERHAYRQAVAANIRGHGLKFLPEVDSKIRFTADLDFNLRVLREIERVYEKLDGDQLHLAVNEHMERIPYPDSRLDLAACLALIERVEHVAAKDYTDCVFRDFAAVARTLTEADHTVQQSEEDVFKSFCADPGQRPQAQLFFDRWMKVALLSLGRSGTSGDARAVSLGLRRSPIAVLVKNFLDAVEPLRQDCGLKLPSLSELGVELPDELKLESRTDA